MESIDAGATRDVWAVEYSFDCDVPWRFAVHEFDAVEELNRPYHVVAQLRCFEDAVDPSELLGKSACITLFRNAHARRFPGIVSRVTSVSTPRENETSCSVVLVPALHGLRYTRRSRIFQAQSTPHILSAVLGDALGRYGRDIDLSGLDLQAYIQRDFCVQYQESDLDFVHRLLEEEGVGYYFDTSVDVHERLVFFDRNADLPRAPTMDDSEVLYSPTTATVMGSEPIVHFEQIRQLTPTAVTVRDHDWTRGMARIESSDAGLNVSESDLRELYDHGHGRGLTIAEDNEILGTLVAAAQQALIPFGIPIALAGLTRELAGLAIGNFTTDDALRQSMVRGQLARRDSSYATGGGLVIGFAPGGVFTLVGHPALNADGKYVVTRVVHRSRGVMHGVEFETNYCNSFECLSAASQWRPARATPKPRIYGAQTGVVTGPPGLDIYTDPHGRVRVKFHWDRAPDDLSGNYTCWIRVSQTWAGSGSPGFMFIPRVGMEVVVTFVDGDPDRPLITGCVYNASNATPQMLPLQATKSIIRTRSVPHGSGYNELSFEDASGMEKVFLRAERHLEEHVRHTHRTCVEVDQINDVKRDQSEAVGRHVRLSIGGDRSSLVYGDESLHVNGNRRETVLGSAYQYVTGGSTTTVERGGHVVDVAEGDLVARAKRSVVLQQEGNVVALGSSDAASGVHIGTSDTFAARAGSSQLQVSEGEGIELSVGASKLVVKHGMIEIVVGGSRVVVTPASVVVNKETMPV